MPDVPRTLYAACPPVDVPFVRAFKDPTWAERATQPDHDWQVVPYHQLPTSGPGRDACIRAMALAEWREDYADHEQREPFDGDPDLYIPGATRLYDALLQHYNQETP
jgi:hypothetical protein